MPRTNRKRSPKRNALKQDLLNLCDSFAEFSDQCTFLCDAFAAISARAETIDPHTANGIEHTARNLKQKVRELGADLNRLNRQARDSQ
jgi:hypothetical protein